MTTIGTIRRKDVVDACYTEEISSRGLSSSVFRLEEIRIRWMKKLND